MKEPALFFHSATPQKRKTPPLQKLTGIVRPLFNLAVSPDTLTPSAEVNDQTPSP